MAENEYYVECNFCNREMTISKWDDWNRTRAYFYHSLFALLINDASSFTGIYTCPRCERNNVISKEDIIDKKDNNQHFLIKNNKKKGV